MSSSARGAGAPLIRWHRLNDLQVTSLLQVASVLLRVVSPLSSSSADTALYLPSHVTRKSVEAPPRAKVRLFVSELNPGAERVAGLICTTANETLRKKKGHNKRPAPAAAPAPASVEGFSSSMRDPRASMSMSTSTRGAGAPSAEASTTGAEATDTSMSKASPEAASGRLAPTLAVTPRRWQRARQDKRPGNFASVVATAATGTLEVANKSPARKWSHDSRKSTDIEAGGGGGPSEQQRMAEMMEGLRIRFADVDTCGDLADATHMLLYLNVHTWEGNAPAEPTDAGGGHGGGHGGGTHRRTAADVSEPEIAATVRRARSAGVPIVMVHEQDEAHGGCPFERFVYQTPYDLISAGLYNELAVALHPSPEETAVALVQIFQKLASTAKRGEAAGQGSPRPRRTNQLPQSWLTSTNSKLNQSRFAAKTITHHLSRSAHSDVSRNSRNSSRRRSEVLVIPQERSEKRKTRAF